MYICIHIYIHIYIYIYIRTHTYRERDQKATQSLASEWDADVVNRVADPSQEAEIRQRVPPMTVKNIQNPKDDLVAILKHLKSLEMLAEEVCMCVCVCVCVWLGYT